MKKNINKKHVTVIVIIIIASIFLGWLFFHSSGEIQTNNPTQETETKDALYTCSMHPQIKQHAPGSCPICGMDLIPVEHKESSEHHMHSNEIHISESALALASVQTSIIKRGIPEKNVHLTGKVQADERNISQITARFGGRIDKLFINYTGQKVKKGDKLAMIYSPALISAQKELLEAIKYKSSNPSFYNATRAKLKQWNLSNKQIDAIETHRKINYSFDIQSPISGTVTKRDISTGDYIKEGSQLFEVIDLSKLWVMFDAYESDLAWIEKGDNIDFNFQSFPGEKFKGKVSFIDPSIDNKTRVAEVRVELNNKFGKIKPGMLADGILKSNTAQNTNELLIPKSAILWTGKRSIVYVKIPSKHETTFQYREIVLGPRAGNFYVVSKGLSEGEEIATNGVFKIDAAAQLAGKSSMMNHK